MTTAPATKTSKFTADQFTASGYDSGTPARKAAFANAFVRFVNSGYDRSKFTKIIYMGLSTHGYFGFIAHYDIDGFYTAQFGTAAERESFWENLDRACARHHSNRPDIWDDVKLAFSESLWE